MTLILPGDIIYLIRSSRTAEKNQNHDQTKQKSRLILINVILKGGWRAADLYLTKLDLCPDVGKHAMIVNVGLIFTFFFDCHFF